MNNRIRIARTGPDTYIGNANESLKLQAGQPFYDIHSNRLYISNQNDKKIRDLINADGVVAYKADRFVTPRSLKTKLDSTAAITFDGSANQDAIPVVGVLPVANGGTGVNNSTTESNITVKNVKSQINSKNISDIFENDGLTVKKANYDLVITSQAEFDNFCASIDNKTCTATSVLFKTGRYVRTGKGLELPRSLLTLDGLGSVDIVFRDFTSDNHVAIYYEDTFVDEFSFLTRISNIYFSFFASPNNYIIGFNGVQNIENCHLSLYAAYNDKYYGVSSKIAR